MEKSKSRKCVDCFEVKLITSDFYRRPNYKGTETVYYNSICKSCAGIRSRKWRDNNLERFRDYQRKYSKNKHENSRKQATR